MDRIYNEDTRQVDYGGYRRAQYFCCPQQLVKETIHKGTVITIDPVSKNKLLLINNIVHDMYTSIAS